MTIFAGSNDATDSPTALQGRRDRQSDGNDVTRGRVFRLADGTDNDGPAAVQERDGNQAIPPNDPGHEQLVLGVSSLPIERESEVPIPREHHQQETDVELPIGIPPTQASGDHFGVDVSHPIQSDGCWYQQPGNAPNTNLLQLRMEPQGVVPPERLPPQLTRRQTNSTLSKCCYLTFMPTTRYALGLLPTVTF